MDDQNSSSTQNQNLPSHISRKRLPNFSSRKLLIPAASLIVILLLIGMFALRKSQQPASAQSSTDKISLQQPLATQTLNKEFSFPLRDTNGKEVSKFKYTIETAEKRDEIIVKGKRAVAVKGRTFLILNLKIRNDFTKGVSVNARDYIRLTVNDSTDKLAADIHNDPVEVQAESTKTTRLGFPINETDKNLTIYVGEISGKKETIKLNLK